MSFVRFTGMWGGAVSLLGQPSGVGRSWSFGPRKRARKGLRLSGEMSERI